jgi:hypothetical protein
VIDWGGEYIFVSPEAGNEEAEMEDMELGRPPMKETRAPAKGMVVETMLEAQKEGEQEGTVQELPTELPPKLPPELRTEAVSSLKRFV